ncbi:MAG: metal-sensing transcriptional repressor [Actinomycetes bacterium]
MNRSPAETAGNPRAADATAALLTARGHLDAIVRMVERDATCPEVLKQLAAVRGLLQTATRAVLRAHLLGCATGTRTGQGGVAMDEIMPALGFPRPTAVPAGCQPARRKDERCDQRRSWPA